MREKIIHFSTPNAAIPGAYISLMYNKLNEAHLNNITARLKRTFKRSLQLLAQEGMPQPALKGLLHSQIYVCDDYQQYCQESGHRGGGTSYVSQVDGSVYSGTAYLYHTELQGFQNLEHEFAHCIQFHWLGQALFRDPKKPLSSFMEGLAEVLAHGCRCTHTLQWSTNIAYAADRNLQNIIALPVTNNLQYDQSYLFVAYLFEKNATELAHIMRACQTNDIKAAEKQLSLCATRYPISFPKWIDELQKLEQEARYMELYCPIDCAQEIDSKALKITNQFFTQHYKAPKRQTGRHEVGVLQNTHFENLIKAIQSQDETGCTLALAQKDLNTNQYDERGLTALHHAVQQRSKKIIGLLFSAKVDITIKSLAEEETAFGIAARKKDTDILAYFIEKLGTQNSNMGDVFRACCVFMEYRQFDVLEDLLLFGDFDVITGFQDKQGLNLLHHAVAKNIQSVKWLLDHYPALINGRDHQNNIALHVAVGQRVVDLDIVGLLIRHNVDIHAKNFEQKSAVRIAIDRKAIDAIKFLVSRDASMKNGDLQAIKSISNELYEEVIGCWVSIDSVSVARK